MMMSKEPKMQEENERFVVDLIMLGIPFYFLLNYLSMLQINSGA